MTKRLKTLLITRRAAERRASAAYSVAAVDALRQADMALRLRDAVASTGHSCGLAGAGWLAAKSELAARIHAATGLANHRAAAAGKRHTDAAFERHAARKALELVLDRSVVEARMSEAKCEVSMPPMQIRTVR
jgi:malonyl CoA-acyl carrier protein transacylase